MPLLRLGRLFVTPPAGARLPAGGVPPLPEEARMVHYVQSERGQPLLVWTDPDGGTCAAELHRWYQQPRDRWPMLVLARKAPGCPWPVVKDPLSLIRAGKDGILILKGQHFALAAEALEGCYQPLSGRMPDRDQCFPAPTWEGSLALARRVLALLGFEPPREKEVGRIPCRVTGAEMALVRMDWLSGREEP